MFDVFVHKLFWPFFLGGLLSVVTVINPVSKIPLFVSLTEELTDAERQQTARKASVYGFAMLTLMLFFGVLVLDAFGISYGALRIAGGLTIALLGFRMLFGYGYVGPSSAAGKRNIAVFPLALPGICGPGAIAAVIGISTEIAELATFGAKTVAYAGSVASITVACLLVWITLHSSRFISRVIGDEGMEALTRLMGFLLVCIGVQFVGSGVRTFIAGS